ncbi:MAG: cyclic pyranopterin monophosphate synthase MoaC [Flavobacteriaceae bacterium]
MSDFSHINKSNQPKMVDVGLKQESRRVARAQALIKVSNELYEAIENSALGNEFHSAKGPVFQTAIIAGIQGVKQCANLIPMCHPLAISGVDIKINADKNQEIKIICEVKVEGKTGVEMEALMGANIAALTVYDMCKAVDPYMVVRELKVLEKQGGKRDFQL